MEILISDEALKILREAAKSPISTKQIANSSEATFQYLENQKLIECCYVEYDRKTHYGEWKYFITEYGNAYLSERARQDEGIDRARKDARFSKIISIIALAISAGSLIVAISAR
ncbi:MAG: hypothetical protein LUE90_06205 [Clostridiales bacterium]|nr:hypothetical protein [Clostridiales bacterium]